MLQKTRKTSFKDGLVRVSGQSVWMYEFMFISVGQADW